MHKTRYFAAALAAFVVSSASWAFHPEHAGEAVANKSRVAEKAFFKPELTISWRNTPLNETRTKLGPASDKAWANFFAKHGNDVKVYIDPRSGTPTNIQGAFPMIPGNGVGNRLTLSTMGQKLGRTVNAVDESVVEGAVRAFIRENLDVLNIDMAQLGPARVTKVTDTLWQLHFPQQVQGIPVRHGRLAATISHGNLILIGTETWGNVRTHTVPLVASDRALENGLGRAGLMFSPKFWKQPKLELVPYAPQDKQRGSTYVGAVGQGYGHRLVWAYGFHDEKDLGKWETMVDAHSGEVIAIEDRNSYVDASFTGGVYPVTSTEICSDPANCGTMQANAPMPWANTGLASPNNFTNGAGVFNFTGGTATTTLSGKYVKVSDSCGAISNSSTAGDIALGGTNGQHDCTSGGGSAGNTAASRSAFYEVNKLAAQARGWLPNNTWLQGQLTANMNINSTCNAFWNGVTINFYRSGGGCRNTGEIGAVFDHEWGHGMDDFDSNGVLSNSSEAYGDIAGNYRLQASCVGHGFFQTGDKGCGATPDGTGFNQNEAQSGAAHCNTNCSGVRDSDWARHSDNTPDTPQNFVCTKCSTGSGPCGRQVHCAAAPVRQAAWDLVTRDLTAAPFNYDSNMAFIVGNKLFYQGSGNVGTWHSCDCTANTSDGCGTTNGYMQWLAADDDNGNLNDGTPHISAIYAAFARHNIACSTPPRTDSGCAGGPTAAPSLSTASGNGQVSLTWTASTGAQNYWVMKTEGHNGCNFGKTLTATVAGTSYTDTEVLNGRQYCYNVVGVGSSNACYSVASNCSCVTPVGICTTPTVPVLAAPANGATGVDGTNTVLSWDVQGGATYDVQVATDSAFANVVRSTNTGSPNWTVTPALSSTTTYYWRVRAVKTCGTTAYSAGSSFTTAAVCAPAIASFDATTKAPLCGTAGGCGCDTGATIVNSRGTVAPAEPNQPNTVDNCADGTSGTYHSDESLDRVSIATTDATALDVGKTVKASFTVWCFGNTDALDIYYSTNATTPTWTTVATGLTCPVSGAAHTFTHTFTLGSTTGRHVLRGQFRYGGTAGTCATGGYNDRDDLVFQVGSGGGCTTPAAPVLATPAAGATGLAVGPVLDWGDVTGATSYDVQVATDSAFTNVVRSGTALAASTWTVTPNLANNTTYHWRARASNSCGAGAYSAGRSFTTVAGSTCALATAAFNATLKAPGCAAASCGCDTGATAINGRGTMTNGNETNRPNAIGGTCADGTSGSYHVDESLDRMVVKSVSGGNLAVGQQATVSATVWCYSTTADFLDLYYTTNANAATPTWTAIATGITCPGTGAQTISRNFTLGSATGNHAVRAQFRYNGTAGTCTSGSYNDRDDLYFSVSAAANPSVERQDSMDGPGDRTASLPD